MEIFQLTLLCSVLYSTVQQVHDSTHVIVGCNNEVYSSQDPVSPVVSFAGLVSIGGAALGMTQDDRTGQIYITEWTSQILRINFDGSDKKIILSGLANPWAIITFADRLFWTDIVEWQVYRSNMDGSAKTVIVSSIRSYGIAVDRHDGKLYLTSQNSGLVISMNQDGLNRVTVLSGLHSPYAITIDSVERTLFVATESGRIVMYELTNNQMVDIYNQPEGKIVRGLAVIGDRLLFLEYYGGLKSIPTYGGQVETVHTTGLSDCNFFNSIYFAKDVYLELPEQSPTITDQTIETTSGVNIETTESATSFEMSTSLESATFTTSIVSTKLTLSSRATTVTPSEFTDNETSAAESSEPVTNHHDYTISISTNDLSTDSVTTEPDIYQSASHVTTDTTVATLPDNVHNVSSKPITTINYDTEKMTTTTGSFIDNSTYLGSTFYVFARSTASAKGPASESTHRNSYDTTSSNSYNQQLDDIEREFGAINRQDIENVNFQDLLQRWDDFSSIFPTFDGNKTRTELTHFDIHIVEYQPRLNSTWDIDVNAENNTYGISIPSTSWTLPEVVSLVVFILKSSVLPENFTDDIGNVFGIGSRILSINLFKEGKMYSYISGNIFNITFSLLSGVRGMPSCQFVTSNGSWSSAGCDVSYRNESHVTCSCNHMTSFALLMQLTEIGLSAAHQMSLTYLGRISLSISVTCLVATLLLYALSRSLTDTRVAIHANLATSLILAQLIFVTGIDAKVKSACIAVTVMLHYLWLVVFMWMLMEGVHLFLKVTPNITWRMQLPICMPLAWGVPAPIVFLTLGLGMEKYAIVDSNEHAPCWLPIEDGMIYAFVAPAGIIMMGNSILLIVVIRKFLALKTNQDKSEYNHMKAGVRAIVILMPLLGVSWIFGVLQFGRTSTIVFAYLFTICNGLQGVFLFISQCLLDENVKTFLRQKFTRGRVDHSIATNDAS